MDNTALVSLVGLIENPSIKIVLIFFFIIVNTFVVIKNVRLDKLIKHKTGENSPHYHRHVHCINDVTILLDKQNYIKHIDVVSKQMKCCEEAIEKMTRYLESVYFDTLLETGLSSSAALVHTDNRHYCNVLSLLGRFYIDYLRARMRENHLAEKSDSELELYIHDKGAQMIELARKTFNTYYGMDSTYLVPRDKLHEVHKKHYKPLLHGLQDLIWECRKLAIQGEKEIAEINKLIEACKNNPC